MKTTTIRTEISRSGQNAYYRETLAAGDDNRHTLRIQIKADSHKPQASAKIERWDGSQWQVVASILPGKMNSEGGLAYGPREPGTADFRQDREALVAMAREVLA
jgi:hypothetical protein